MKKIGFIGLGTMGLPMAANLARKGYAVTVYNRTPGRAEEAARLGANVASSPREAARSADVVVTMVSHDRAVEEVYGGESGVLAGLQPGTTVIDCSTISPALARRLAEDVRARNCDFLDAPVTGSKPAAEDGTLLFMVGGDSAALERHRDVLMAMGREAIHVGGNGNGATAKLAHNTIVGINAAGLLEGVTIAAKSGIDLTDFLRIVQNGGAASKQADLKGRKLVERDYSVQFSLALMLKDLNLSADLTERLGVAAPMLEASRKVFRAGQEAGYGEQDLSALIHVYEQWSGTRVGGAPDEA